MTSSVASARPAPAAGPASTRPVHIGVLALQGDFREHLRAVHALGGTASAVRRPTELDALDGLIIPGGESTTMDKLSRSFGLAEPLRERIAGGLPVYGSCAGLIMLADRVADPSTDRDGNPQQTFGGLDVTVRRNAFGRQRESFETDLQFSGLTSVHDGGQPAPVHAVFIRAPWVEQAGEAVQVLARFPGPPAPPDQELADPTGRIVAVRSGNVLATSFHPEVNGEHRIHELFIRIIRGEA
jgi:5'-phosphate synthase pdxT subunit